MYDGEAMMLAASIPVWGDHFTRDIATIFKVTYEDAESLKQEYGCAMLGITADSSLIEVPSPEGRPSREARRSELNEILEARAEELFLIRALRNSTRWHGTSLHEGIILTGGGAMLTGMCDMAERVLDCQAANGLVTEEDIGGWPEELESPAWTATARAGHVFGEVEDAPAAARKRRRPDGFGIEITTGGKAWHLMD